MNENKSELSITKIDGKHIQLFNPFMFNQTEIRLTY